ncbi:MAG: hypothetical protein IJV76_03985, partial [Clostridia bacterium]|nr:hypothetical protein [Clostridia bacterium]
MKKVPPRAPLQKLSNAMDKQSRVQIQKTTTLWQRIKSPTRTLCTHEVMFSYSRTFSERGSGK